MSRVLATGGSLLLLLALALLLPARSFLPGDRLLVETLTSFAPQYALLAVVMALWLWWRRRWLRGLAFMLLLVPELAGFLGSRPAPPDDLASAHPRLMVFSANLFESSRAVRSAVDQVEALDADLVWWSEFPRDLDPDTRARVGELDARYPFGFELAAADGRDIRFLSRYPLRTRQTFEPPLTSGRPALRLSLDVRGQLLTVFALHTHPPTSAWSLRARNETLDWLQDELAALEGRAIVMGDLNTSAFAPRFAELIREGGLDCASPWRCAVASWPTFVPVLLTPIDHILVGGELAVTQLRRGRFTGSDHFPVVAEIVFL
ncbi:MAG: hypothetical protein EA417_18920 [Gammaproteobacteria bacterium]|nr:MAG: hypothetical protein EA417_18920 [Gammaproteobacteria bacterium]